MADRPPEFRMCGGHPLAQGLVFAGLGRHAFSTYYHDSCADMNRPGNHGTLTNMEPATDWVWSQELGRFVLNFGGTDETVTIASAAAIQLQPPFAMSAWFWKSSDAGFMIFANDYNAGNRYSGAWLAFRLQEDFWASMGDNTGGSAAVDSRYKLSASTYGLSTWHHAVANFVSTTSVNLYVNGVDAGGSMVGSGTGLVYDNAGAHLQRLSSAGIYSVGMSADNLIYNRLLSLSEISAIADPSNVMLSGLLLPPARRLFAAVSAAPTGFKTAWARRQSQLIGGAV